MDQNLLGWRSEALGVDHVLTHNTISIFSIISPFNIIEYLYEYLYGLIHTNLYTYIYIDVFIELYCDISDIPLKYVFFSPYFSMKSPTSCVTSQVVWSRWFTPWIPLWLGSAIRRPFFLGDQPGGKQHYVCISVIQSLYIYYFTVWYYILYIYILLYSMILYIYILFYSIWYYIYIILQYNIIYIYINIFTLWYYIYTLFYSIILYIYIFIILQYDIIYIYILFYSIWYYIYYFTVWYYIYIYYFTVWYSLIQLQLAPFQFGTGSFCLGVFLFMWSPCLSFCLPRWWLRWILKNGVAVVKPHAHRCSFFLSPAKLIAGQQCSVATAKIKNLMHSF